MPKYDLGKIGHIEFERMCQSLIQQFIGSGVQIFGSGKDGAREATFVGKANYPSAVDQWEGQWIFQVKYHDLALLGVEKARRKIIDEIDEELLKIVSKYKHNCDNFILLTNVPLSPAYKSGTKDVINQIIVPKYTKTIKNIAVMGADEICGLLDNHPNIRKTYREYVTSGDILDYIIEGFESQESYLGDIIQAYCYNLLHKDEKHAVLDDAGDSEDKRVELQDVFIDLNVKPLTKIIDSHYENRERVWEEYSASDADEEEYSAMSFLLNDEILDVVLVGGPGEGKSTLTQFISQIHRAKITKQIETFLKNFDVEYIAAVKKARTRIPFRIVLKEYAQWFNEESDNNILNYISNRIKTITGREVKSEDIHKIFKGNSVLLILDGLDEVPEKKMKEKIVTNTIITVKEFRELFSADIKVVATTRPFGYTDEFDPKSFLHLSVLKLSETQARDYTERWIAAKQYDKEESKRIFDKFLVCLQDNVIKVLTTTPLQVTIVLVIIRARGILPKQREELFETYMDTIYQREQKKNVNLLRTEKELILGLHKYFAYILQKKVETDKTASLMDEAEFRDHVRIFVNTQNPMIPKIEREELIDQLIKEAEERLILITNNPKGKIGFPLTSMREFLAAAHLVDTSAGTEERDSRFKSIALSTHWRNVTLFFAGRVGRTRPGEVSSMIDVCRTEIDLEFPDNYLKRGANLVVDMIEDRAIRVQRNEMSAIQYSLTLLEEGYIYDFEQYISKLNGFSDQAKDHVIKPFLEKKLSNYQSKKISLIWKVYNSLFGQDEFFEVIINEALNISDEVILRLAIEYAIKFELSPTLIVKSWGKLCEAVNDSTAVKISNTDKIKLLKYLEEQIPHIVLVSIAKSLTMDELRYRFLDIDDDVNKLINELRKLDHYNRNQIFVVTFLKILAICNEQRQYFKQGINVINNIVHIIFPFYVNCNISKKINDDFFLFNNFTEIFNDKEDLFTISLNLVSSFFIKENKNDILKKIFENFDSELDSIKRDLFISSQNHLYKLDKVLKWDFDSYNYEEVMSMINKIINEESDTPDNAYKFLLWIETEFNKHVENSLDQEKLYSLKGFMKTQRIPEEVLLFSQTILHLSSTSEFSSYLINLMKKFMLDTETLNLSSMQWLFQDGEVSKELCSEVLFLLEQTLSIITNDKLEDPQFLNFLSWVLGQTLDLNLVKENHLLQLKSKGFNGYFSKNIYLRRNYNDLTLNLVSFMNNKNEEISELAIILYTQYHSKPRGFKPNSPNLDYVSLYLWALYNKNICRIEVLESLSSSDLKWSKLAKGFLDSISINNDEEDKIWVKIINRGGYNSEEDRLALIEFLNCILDGEYNDSYKNAAIKRLYEVSLESEMTDIPESELNLPLPSYI